jgi:branched-chain amino acid aminotransferase
VPYRFEEHMARLARSASAIGLGLPKGEGEIWAALAETLDANALREALVRITVSRGEGPLGLDPALAARPTFVVMAFPFREYPESYYKVGVSAIVARTRRMPRAALDPAIKSLNFLNNIQARREAVERGAFEALMLNARGRLAEGTVSNVFFVREGAVFTPSKACGILAGVTRDAVVSLARAEGYRVRQGGFRKEELLGADEVFLTNSSLEVVPVGELEGIKIAPGAVTRALRAAYLRDVERYVAERATHRRPG